MRRAILAAAFAAALVGAPAAILTTAQAQTTTPAASAQTTTKKPQSAGLTAMHERQKKCGAEWKEAKAAGKIEKGMTWPKYWSACNKHLKAGG